MGKAETEYDVETTPADTMHGDRRSDQISDKRINYYCLKLNKKFWNPIVWHALVRHLTEFQCCFGNRVGFWCGM